jgi:RNA polymerase sigma-70 factor (ECF subfamily)
VPRQDEKDVAQEVFLEVFKKLGSFIKDGEPAAFRRWLYAITRNKVLEYWRRVRQPDSVKISAPDPPPDDSSEVAEDSVPERVLLLRHLVKLIRREFEPRTWDAFWRVACEGSSAEDVAKELDMRVGAVYTAKSRVLKRLREEAKALGFNFPLGNVVTADVAVAAQREVTS